ncbi:hypothetical protein [Clostridium beijerinckii]|uniref:Uncharacterized membrane protein HdeD (DUF308 family) n=1 Tax=Clostridium beijerinckii TaxID=1520 RepID=A0AAX0AUK5_CLOBE|nr:hypothetical protein [Clostridium beijerinckii]MBA8934267.1 uncharacterized membrane protein HdeD (DUF308 family) [Clostridium beijerinckii]NOW04810.1 uncharacterized membrane protein HdeD (DUF308 family) [Clostridium beijerinckii]NRT86730.1 uncharacterized membrane protein HdeD (DUF308 family) [Clostridium beijerinckii]NRU38459.1 uncharacterized membrane protein HdeD (DUF308 family) [Clostridium beijerinckii]NSA98262.1 uncharacterized membrane protein HdeD (DUF308 family) [Clostridium beij
MIFRNVMSIVSSLISLIYGFSILLILDMINHKVNCTPIFKYPSNKSILIFLISFAIYTLSVFLLSLAARLDSKKQRIRFILVNVISFAMGLILFIWIGVIFFINTDSGP